jgi:integrase
MARIVRDTTLDSRSARARLKIRTKPYYRALDPGLHLGYRRSANGGAWLVRFYLGKQAYRLERLATADDKADADGVAVLNFSQAQALARARHVAATRREAGMPDAGPYTVAAAMDDYVAWLEHERRTARDARWAADAFIVPKLGHVLCERLTAQQITKWLHDLAKAPPRLRAKKGEKPRHRKVDATDDEAKRRRQSSANRILTTLKAALNKAWRDERVASDKAWRSVQPFQGADASRVRYLSLDECRRLINACDEDFRHLVRAALHTGARYSELARLKPDHDFNPDAGTIAVRRSKSSKPRHVILTEDGVRFFAEAVAHAHNREFLFVRDDGRQWGKSFQFRPMNAAYAAARIKDATFHTLRHTYASHAIMNGTPLLVVARNLGHRDTRMVEKHYGHLAPSYEADAIRAGALRFESGGDRVVTPMAGRAHRPAL